MKVIIRRINAQAGNETGAILTAFERVANKAEKLKYEQQLIHFASSRLYPEEGLSFYSNTHDDVAAITVVRGINDLASSEESI